LYDLDDYLNRNPAAAAEYAAGQAAKQEEKENSRGSRRGMSQRGWVDYDPNESQY
jgi:hypothetical protein